MNDYEKQKDFESKFSNTNLNKVVKDFLINQDAIKIVIDSNPDYRDPILRLLTDLVINRRVLVSSEVGRLLHYFDENAQDAADLISCCIDAGLCLYQEETNQLVVRFIPEGEELERINYMMHPLPMIVKPRKVVSNYDSPYLNSEKESQIYNSSIKEDVCLDVLNSLNSIPLRINSKIRDMGVNAWSSVSEKSEAIIDEYAAPNERRTLTERQFKIFNHQMKVVLNMWVKELPFFLPWKFDRRGRFYDEGYLIKVQGNDFQKAIVEFAEVDFVKK